MATAPNSWFDLATAALSGGLVVKLLDKAFDEFQRRRIARAASQSSIGVELDPILKSADELFGKLRALAEEDFSEFRHRRIDPGANLKDCVALTSVMYLFANFWARFEILRRQRPFTDLTKDDHARQLWGFIRCIESKRVRIVDRGWQRAMGECLLVRRSNGYECMTFREFTETYLAGGSFADWFKPLRTVIEGTDKQHNRQRLLHYGVIIHALVDTLDIGRHITTTRPSYPNKLSIATRRELHYKTFKVYLPFVKNPDKYTRWREVAESRKARRTAGTP